MRRCAATGSTSARWARSVITAFNALYYAAASLTGAINLSIIQGAIPAFVLLAARFGFGDTVTALQALGAFAALAGVTAIAAQGDWSRLAGLAFNVGDLMVLIACLLYAGYTLGLRERPRVSPLGLLAGMALAAFVSSAPLFVGEVAAGRFIWPTGAGLLLLLYAALGPAFAGQLFYMRGVELIGPGRAGAFVNLVPAFGALMAVVLLGEPFAAYDVVALALVVGGVAIAQRAPRQRLAGHGRRDVSAERPTDGRVDQAESERRIRTQRLAGRAERRAARRLGRRAGDFRRQRAHPLGRRRLRRRRLSGDRAGDLRSRRARLRRRL